MKKRRSVIRWLILSLFVFLLVLFIFSLVFQTLLFFLFFFFALYFFDFFPIHSLGIGISRKTFTRFLYRIFQFSQIHKSTNIPNASFFLLFFYFHFSSFFHFCKMSYIDSMYWHFYLISLHFKCQISVILFFFNLCFFIYWIRFCSQSCLIIKRKKQ